MLLITAIGCRRRPFDLQHTLWNCNTRFKTHCNTNYNTHLHNVAYCNDWAHRRGSWALHCNTRCNTHSNAHLHRAAYYSDRGHRRGPLAPYVRLLLLAPASRWMSKKDLHMSKETYICQKRPTIMCLLLLAPVERNLCQKRPVERNLCPSKETCIGPKGPNYVTREIYIQKDLRKLCGALYLCRQSPLKVTRDPYIYTCGALYLCRSKSPCVCQRLCVSKVTRVGRVL